jgi:hypothetical protein
MVIFADVIKLADRGRIGSMRIFGIVALGAALGGCASSGVQVSQSTYSDVITALGQPDTVSTSSNGQKIATYSYAAVSSRGQNFIPFGTLITGYDTKSSAVTFTFDAQGVLTDVTPLQSKKGTGANLAAGDQPASPTQQSGESK